MIHRYIIVAILRLVYLHEKITFNIQEWPVVFEITKKFKTGCGRGKIKIPSWIDKLSFTSYSVFTYCPVKIEWRATSILPLEIWSRCEQSSSRRCSLESNREFSKNAPRILKLSCALFQTNAVRVCARTNHSIPFQCNDAKRAFWSRWVGRCW